MNARLLFLPPLFLSLLTCFCAPKASAEKTPLQTYYSCSGEWTEKQFTPNGIGTSGETSTVVHHPVRTQFFQGEAGYKNPDETKPTEVEMQYDKEFSFWLHAQHPRYYQTTVSCHGPISRRAAEAKAADDYREGLVDWVPTSDSPSVNVTQSAPQQSLQGQQAITAANGADNQSAPLSKRPSSPAENAFIEQERQRTDDWRLSTTPITPIQKFAFTHNRIAFSEWWCKFDNTPTPIWRTGEGGIVGREWGGICRIARSGTNIWWPRKRDARENKREIISE
jgi:hypothetical protein